MTPRGRLALALGLVAYVAAWAFGSKPLYPVAVGLVLTVLLAWAWVRLANRPVRLRRVVGSLDPVEGDDVAVDLVVVQETGLVPDSLHVQERIARLGARSVDLHRRGRRLHGRYVLQRVPRGRYAFEPAELSFEDPFGLERVTQTLPASEAVLVYPRLVEIDRLFSESGTHAHDGRRVLLRRPTGYDLHSVREYEQGESLRKVHWRSTAHRGQLMVKELEDAPRDEIAVLLDADAGAVAGRPPDSSFDAQVRAAGSILQAHVRRGRRAGLVVNSALRESRRIHSDAGDWRLALELLAAAEPTGRIPAAALLEGEASIAARAFEVTVVTARLTGELVDRLIQRALGRRGVAVVYVDAATFAGAAPTREPALLRLGVAGIPVAVVRRGDDLAAALSAPALQEAARA